MNYTTLSKIKVCLVYPRLRLPTGDPPLGLAYIASSLIASGKAEVRIVDATFNPSISRISSLIKDFDPEIVGIYVDTLLFNDAITVAALAKQCGRFVITGGPHATVMPEKFIAHSDIVVIGEGEQTIVEIIERYRDKAFDSIPGIWYNISGEAIKTTARNSFVDLDTIKFPAFELLDMKSYMARWNYLDCLDVNLKGTNLVSSRGCPFDCTYCQPTLKNMFGNKIRFRSPENIVEEIKFMQKSYNINSFFFHDDTLTADKNRILSLCDTIKKSDLKIYWACNTRVDTIDTDMMKIMYAAGLRKLHIGAESGSQRILDQIYHKNITTEQVRHVVSTAKEVGLHCFCFFILGAPTETKNEIKQTIRFACSLPIDEASFSILSPLPGTEIRESILSDSCYTVSGDTSEYNYHSKRTFIDPYLSSHYVKSIQVIALIKFYTHYRRWYYLLKHLVSLNGIKKLIMKVCRFF